LRRIGKLADDQLHGVAVARSHTGLIAIAASHELDQTPSQLRFEQTELDAARSFSEEGVAVDLQLRHVAGGDLGADVRVGRRIDRGDHGLPHLLDEEVEVDARPANLEAFLLVQQCVDAGRVFLGDRVHRIDLQGRLI